jgi:hypothetical protein
VAETRPGGAHDPGRLGEIDMLQELAAQTGASSWAIGSMVFFVAAWAVIAWRVYRARPEDLDARAHLALEGEARHTQDNPPATRTDR